MLTSTELSHLERSLRGTKALSVYVVDGAADPAQRTVWQRALDDAIDAERDALAAPDAASHDERAAFERAAEHVRTLAATLAEGPRFVGWAAFATADGVRWAETLRVPVPPLAAWGDGIRIAPCVRALEPRDDAAVAVVDSRSAHLFAYHDGTLTGQGVLHAETSGPEPHAVEPHMGQPARQGFHAGTRGATRTDTAARVRRVRRERLLRTVAARLTELAGHRGWMLLGGTTTAIAAATRRLPADVRARARALDGIDVRATVPEIGARVAALTAALRRESIDGELRELLDRHAAGGAASVDLAETRDALRARAVDRVYLSERFLRDDALAAEGLVRAALDQDAAIVCVDGAAAERLDAEAGGVAVRLRFVPPREQPPVVSPGATAAAR